MRKMACITYLMWRHGQSGNGFEWQQIPSGFEQHSEQFKTKVLSCTDFSFGTYVTPEHVSKSSHDRDSIKFTEINSQLPSIFSRAGISSSAR